MSLGFRPFTLILLTFFLVGSAIAPALASHDTIWNKRRIIASKRANQGLLNALGFSDRFTDEENGAFTLFMETMNLIRKHYVGVYPHKEAFNEAIQRLTLYAPPQCMEGCVRYEDCWDGPEQCLLRTMETICQRCAFNKEELSYKVLNWMLSDMDHNSAVLDPAMLQEISISTSGKFGGVGMVVSRKAGDYVVISAIEGSPAHRAGIRPGAVVLEIDGQSIHGMNLPNVLKMVRGRVGERITLKIGDPGSNKVRRVVLRRSLIRISPVRHKILPNNIGYLRIVNFQQSVFIETKKALTEIYAKTNHHPKGLIIDLRDNPGGLFDQAIKVADLFLDSEVIISVRGNYEKLNKDFRATGNQEFPRTPIVVLINRGSASAAEILAGALQSRPNVLVAGERSFGKASVQGVFPLSDGMALRLTTAHYFTPDGRNIDGKGIDPDIVFNKLIEESDRLSAYHYHEKAPETDQWITRALELLPDSSRGRSPIFLSLF
jgi:carboxyl-terminal processing protease